MAIEPPPNGSAIASKYNISLGSAIARGLVGGSFVDKVKLPKDLGTKINHANCPD